MIRRFIKCTCAKLKFLSIFKFHFFESELNFHFAPFLYFSRQSPMAEFNYPRQLLEYEFFLQNKIINEGKIFFFFKYFQQISRTPCVTSETEHIQFDQPRREAFTKQTIDNTLSLDPKEEEKNKKNWVMFWLKKKKRKINVGETKRTLDERKKEAKSGSRAGRLLKTIDNSPMKLSIISTKFSFLRFPIFSGSIDLYSQSRKICITNI